MLEYMSLRSDTMSYETDAMRSLSASLRNTEGLKYTLKELQLYIIIYLSLEKTYNIYAF